MTVWLTKSAVNSPPFSTPNSDVQLAISPKPITARALSMQATMRSAPLERFRLRIVRET